MNPELFTSPVAKHLLCVACSQVPRDPVLHSTCGHSFCSSCLLPNGSPGVCPKDADSVVDATCIIPNLTLKDRLSQLKLHCPYRYRLATATVPAEEFAPPATPLPQLALPLVPLEDDGCTFVVTLGDLDLHLKSCPRRLAIIQHQQQQHLQALQVSPASNTTSRHTSRPQSPSESALIPATTASTAAAAALDSNWLPSRDQLRTMLANQRRLEEAVATLASRLAALSCRFNQRLDALEDASPLPVASPEDRHWLLAQRPPPQFPLPSVGNNVQLRAAASSSYASGPQPPRDSTVSTATSECDASFDAGPSSKLSGGGGGGGGGMGGGGDSPTSYVEWTMPFSLTCIGSYCGHTAPILHLASALTGSSSGRLFSFAMDGEIRVWVPEGGRCLGRAVWSECANSEARLTSACTAINVSASAQQQSLLLLVGSSTGCLAKLSMSEDAAAAATSGSQQLIVDRVAARAHAGPVSAMCTQWRLLFTASGPEIRVWRLPELSALCHVTNLQREIGAMCLMPGVQRTLLAACRNRICLMGVSDARTAGGGGGGVPAVGSADESQALSLTRMLRKNFGIPSCVVATQRHIVVGTAKKGIWVFDSHLGYHVTCLGVELGPVKSLACTPSGNWLLSTSLDGAMHVWDIRGQRQVQRTHWHRGAVLSVLLLGDNVYSGAMDTEIKIFKYNNLKMLPIYQQIAGDARASQLKTL